MEIFSFGKKFHIKGKGSNLKKNNYPINISVKMKKQNIVPFVHNKLYMTSKHPSYGQSQRRYPTVI